MLLLTQSFGFEHSLEDDLNVFLYENIWHGAMQKALKIALPFFVCITCEFIKLDRTSPAELHRYSFNSGHSSRLKRKIKVKKTPPYTSSQLHKATQEEETLLNFRDDL